MTEDEKGIVYELNEPSKTILYNILTSTEYAILDTLDTIEKIWEEADKK